MYARETMSLKSMESEEDVSEDTESVPFTNQPQPRWWDDAGGTTNSNLTDGDDAVDDETNDGCGREVARYYMSEEEIGFCSEESE
jgi:hypothetical protein